MANATDSLKQELDRLTALLQLHHGRLPTTIEPMAAGLGTRRFYRIRWAEGEPRTMIARVEPEPAVIERTGLGGPPAWHPEPALEPIRTFLEASGLPVPRSYAHFVEDRIDLLEDVGDRTLADATGTTRARLYHEACSLVPRLQRLSATPERVPAFGRRFDRSLIETKAWKWLNWTIPGLLGREASTHEKEALQSAFAQIAHLLEQAPRRLAHRDFKAENLHWQAAREGPSDQLVMIDVQGAFMAPPEYDLVCLLYDLQVDLDEDFVRHRFRETLPELPDAPDAETAALRFDALATIRLAKDISHVVHAARSRQDARRWHDIPRGLALLDRAAGRLGHSLPETRALTSVIQALSQAARSSDSPTQGLVR